MRVPPTVFASAGQLGQALAHRIAQDIEEAAAARRAYVLGCPGGRSPRATYLALAAEVRTRSLDLSRVVIAMMDDYVEQGADEGFVHVAADLPYSCRRFAHDEIAGPLTAAAGPGRGIRDEHVWFPDPAAPADYDHRLAAAGGIDLFLLATGATDGHVAFNPPHSPRQSTSRVVVLADSTRRDNLATFPMMRAADPTSLEQVPTHGVTVGIDTIARYSRGAVMIATGRDKQTAAGRLSTASSYQPDWPATVLSECPQPDLFLDTEAAAALGTRGSVLSDLAQSAPEP